MAAASTPSAGAEPRPGLRERKKIRTRQAIRAAAYRLFAEQGYETTSVDRIAEAAEVSPSTVFRYFPTKEDIVLLDGCGPALHEALRARPAGEPPLTALRRAVVDVVAAAYGTRPEETHQRMRLVARVPALRARLVESVTRGGGSLAAALAERAGSPGAGLELRVCTGALLGGLAEAALHASEHVPAGDAVDTVAGALERLERGLSSAGCPAPPPAPADRRSAGRR